MDLSNFDASNETESLVPPVYALSYHYSKSYGGQPFQQNGLISKINIAVYLQYFSL